MNLDDENLFALYFAQVAGWQFHPGSGHGEHKVKSIGESADFALEMLREHRSRFPRDEEV